MKHACSCSVCMLRYDISSTIQISFFAVSSAFVVCLFVCFFSFIRLDDRYVLAALN